MSPNPDRVMIYGQSGGGSKVTTLLGMPSAQGLIHRASVQSGGGGNPPSAEQSREYARQVMKELGLGPNEIGALQKMEWTGTRGVVSFSKEKGFKFQQWLNVPYVTLQVTRVNQPVDEMQLVQGPGKPLDRAKLGTPN